MTGANEEWLQSFRNHTRTKSGERPRPAFPNSLPRFAVVSAVSAENSILDKARFGEPPKTNTRAACAPQESIVDFTTEIGDDAKENFSVCFVSFVVNEMIVS